MNHMIEVIAGTATIQNLNLQGTEKAKSGIVCYGLDTKVDINQVTATGFGAVGVQVSGADVTVTDLTTSGNAWGAVNVDKDTVNQKIPHLVFHSGTMAEDVEIYTEITDQDVVEAASLTKVQGFGPKLKGFVYYTSDAAKLHGVANIGEGKIAETLQAAVDAAGSEDQVVLIANVTEDIKIPVGKTLKVKGEDKTKTIFGMIKLEASGSANTEVEFRDLVLDGKGKRSMAINSQNQTDNGQMEAIVRLYGVVIQNYTNKAIYMTNAKRIHMTGCTVQNCATGEMDTPNTKGDYAVDLNLVAVQDAVVSIVNNYFKGYLGQKSAVKVAQRGGESDQQAGDIPKHVGEAKVQQALFTGNACTEIKTTPVMFTVGSSHKSGGTGVNTTGAFAAKVMVSTTDPEVVIKVASKESDNTLTVPTGRTAIKGVFDEMFVLEANEEEAGAAIEDAISNIGEVPGLDVQPDPEGGENAYKITTTDGSLSNSTLFDNIAAIPGVKTIVVSNGSEDVTYITGGDMSEFKTKIDALLPKDNLAEEVTLTMTVTLN